MFGNPSRLWNWLWSRKSRKIISDRHNHENTLIASQQQCSLTIAYDNLKYTEVYKSDAKTLHGVIIFRIVDGNYIYIYMNFSCTEACGSKMKTTALCVFALFLSSMLVEGGMVNYKCLPSGNCKRAKVHE